MILPHHDFTHFIHPFSKTRPPWGGRALAAGTGHGRAVGAAEQGHGMAPHALAFGRMPNAAARMAALPVHPRAASTETLAKTVLIGRPS